MNDDDIMVCLCCLNPDQFCACVDIFGEKGLGVKISSKALKILRDINSSTADSLSDDGFVKISKFNEVRDVELSKEIPNVNSDPIWLESSSTNGEDLATKNCEFCDRSFLPSALKRHESVCKEVFCSKRQPSLSRHLVGTQEYNSVLERIEEVCEKARGLLDRNASKRPENVCETLSNSENHRPNKPKHISDFDNTVNQARGFSASSVDFYHSIRCLNDAKSRAKEVEFVNCGRCGDLFLSTFDLLHHQSTCRIVPNRSSSLEGSHSDERVEQRGAISEVREDSNEMDNDEMEYLSEFQSRALGETEPATADFNPMNYEAARVRFVDDSPDACDVTHCSSHISKSLQVRLEERRRAQVTFQARAESPAILEAPETGESLVKCGSCDRYFTPSALKRHGAVCKTVFCSKRQPFLPHHPSYCREYDYALRRIQKWREEARLFGRRDYYTLRRQEMLRKQQEKQDVWFESDTESDTESESDSDSGKSDVGVVWSLDENDDTHSQQTEKPVPRRAIPIGKPVLRVCDRFLWRDEKVVRADPCHKCCGASGRVAIALYGQICKPCYLSEKQRRWVAPLSDSQALCIASRVGDYDHNCQLKYSEAQAFADEHWGWFAGRDCKWRMLQIRCPGCERHFRGQTAAVHIPQCSGLDLSPKCLMVAFKNVLVTDAVKHSFIPNLSSPHPVKWWWREKSAAARAAMKNHRAHFSSGAAVKGFESCVGSNLSKAQQEAASHAYWTRKLEAKLALEAQQKRGRRQGRVGFAILVAALLVCMRLFLPHQAEFVAADRAYTYRGAMLRGQFHGHGNLSFTDSPYSYSGEWANGQRNGRGESVSEDGRYAGLWRNDLRHGFGEMTFNDGTVYSGHYQNGLRHGSAVVTLYYGDIFEGHFVDNVRKGFGTLRKTDGSIYSGSWENFVRHGRGALTTSSGLFFDCEWRNDVMKECYTEPSLWQVCVALFVSVCKWFVAFK